MQDLAFERRQFNVLRGTICKILVNRDAPN